MPLEPLAVPFAYRLKPQYRQGLVGHWKMNVGGVIIPDLSGNNNHGTRTNYNNTATSGWVGQGDIFDGTNDYIKTGIINHNIGTGDFTLSARVLVTSANDWQTIISSGDYCPALYYRPTGLYLYFGGGRSSGLLLNLNTWYYIVGMRKNGYILMYVNNNRYISPTTDTTNIPNTTIQIGTSATTGGEYFSGIIDDVRVKNYAMSTDEIAHNCFFQEDEWDFGDTDIIMDNPVPISIYQERLRRR